MQLQTIKLSPEFKAQTTKAIFAIILFVIVYMMLFLFVIGITFFCAYSGIMIIAATPSLITILVGGGLASLGILLVIFLLKFIFKSHKVDRSHLIEIKKADEPKLFLLIEEIVKEVGTSFPKKVYVSADVNASVFYDSSFWSMFFPVKKNLQIGMGLVNTISTQELKAILAHEFGHFSQRTMKVGSYVYNVNQVIFNMLYDNQSYDKIVQSWSSIHIVISLFVLLAVKIIQGIQWLLKLLYGIINKTYMALSREMEFHADEIASHVTGYEPLKSSLLRMSLADHAFNILFRFYDERFDDNFTSTNIYPQHYYVMNVLAEDNEVAIIDGLPNITKEELTKFNKSKLVIKDQWASHPSTQERIDRLEKNNVTATQISKALANTLFNNLEVTEQALTTLIFKNAQYKGEPNVISFDFFQKEFTKDFEKNTFPKIYNGYYDNKNPLTFELLEQASSTETPNFDTLFSPQKLETVLFHSALVEDMEVIEQIAKKSIPVKSFDYDGRKYNRKEAHALLSKLKKEEAALEEEIKLNDIQIYSYFKKLEDKSTQASVLDGYYKEMFEFDTVAKTKSKIYDTLVKKLEFIHVTTPHETIASNFREIEKIETQLKEEINLIMVDPKFQEYLSQDIKDNFTRYLSQQWKYFKNDAYLDTNLEMLFNAMNNYLYILSKGYFLIKSSLLKYQEGLVRIA